MTQEQFEKRLAEIAETARREVSILVGEVREENADGQHGDAPVDFTKGSAFQNWERTADGLAELCGWIYDRMAGKRREARGSITKKLRRALGYNV